MASRGFNATSAASVPGGLAQRPKGCGAPGTLSSMVRTATTRSMLAASACATPLSASARRVASARSDCGDGAASSDPGCQCETICPTPTRMGVLGAMVIVALLDLADWQYVRSSPALP